MMCRATKLGCVVMAAVMAGLALACFTPRPTDDEIKAGIKFASDLSPHWSADGDTVVSWINYGIYGSDANGGELWRAVSSRHNLYGSALSADGRLAFAKYRRGWTDFEVEIRQLSGRSSDSVATVDVRWVPDLAWSPDGSMLALTSGGYIVVFDRDGRELHRFFHPHPDPSSLDNDRPWGLSWSPNGERIAYLMTTLVHWRVITTRADGTGLTTVASIASAQGDPFTHALSAPSWSPDGQRIYYTTWNGDERKSRVYSAAVDGSDDVEIAVIEGGYIGSVKASPDGRSLLAVSAPGVFGFSPGLRVNTFGHTLEGGLYLLDVDGRNLRQLGERHLNASWSPSGDRIAVSDTMTGEPKTLYIIHPGGSPDQVLVTYDARGGKPVGAGN